MRVNDHVNYGMFESQETAACTLRPRKSARARACDEQTQQSTVRVGVQVDGTTTATTTTTATVTTTTPRLMR